MTASGSSLLTGGLEPKRAGARVQRLLELETKQDKTPIDRLAHNGNYSTWSLFLGAFDAAGLADLRNGRGDADK